VHLSARRVSIVWPGPIAFLTFFGEIVSLFRLGPPFRLNPLTTWCLWGVWWFFISLSFFVFSTSPCTTVVVWLFLSPRRIESMPHPPFFALYPCPPKPCDVGPLRSSVPSLYANRAPFSCFTSFPNDFRPRCSVLL